MVEEPARRGHHHVHSAPERMLLRAHADAAIDRRTDERRMHGERVEVIENLGRQLPRRGEDERTRDTPRPIDQPVHDGQQEGRGLAAPGLSTGQQVTAGHRRRDGLGLNRRRADESELANPLLQARVEVQTL